MSHTEDDGGKEKKTADTEESSAGSRNDSLDPFYISNSDSPGLLLANKFDGIGFICWKQQMLIALGAKNKLGFIDGSISKPQISDPNFKSWKRCDDMVKSWILMVLDRTIADSVLFGDTAASIWKELCDRFDQSDAARIYGLEQQMNSATQGTDSIVTYYTRIKMLWNEMDSTRTLPVCICGGSDSFQKYIQQSRVMKFLMGLNERYSVIRENILMLTPIPAIETVFSLLIHQERQKTLTHGSASEPASLSFAADYSKKPPARSQGGNTRRSNFYCTNCNKSGHTEDRCFLKIGFPPNWRTEKGKRSAANQCMDEKGDGPKDPFGGALTADQVNQLLEYISKAKPNKDASSSDINCGFVGM